MIVNSKLQISNYKQATISKNSNFKILKIVIVLLFGVCFLGFGILSPIQALTLDCSSGFTSLQTGINYKNVGLTTPRNINLYIVKANLKQSGLKLVVTPRDSVGNTTSGFLNEQNVDVAINANPFYGPSVAGINGYTAAVSAGDIYSTAKETYSLYADKNNNANIDDLTSIPSTAWNLISGFEVIMKNGILNTSIANCKDANYCTVVTNRTAVGLTNDNQLILVVAEQASLPELAQIMTTCGAPTSLNLDGGGSSTMAIKGQGVVNHPSDGTERVVATHLGICVGDCQGSLSPITGYYCDTTKKQCLPCHQGDLNSGCSPAPLYSTLNQATCITDCAAPEQNPIGPSNFSGNPIPPPTVPCYQVRPASPITNLNPASWFQNEFSSLRPYQASPCQTAPAPSARFCGNNLTLEDGVQVKYPGSESLLTGNGCTPIGDKIHCTYKVPVSEKVTINLTGANLPFMGNTENTTNSQNPTGDSPVLSDAAKVNGYVSWFLNGVFNRAESSPLDVAEDCIGVTTQVAGVCTNTLAGICLNNPLDMVDGANSCTGKQVCCVTRNPLAEKVTILDRDKLINYSGPLNKLLPQEVKQQEQAQTVKNAVASLPSFTSPTGAGIRHDQVIGCTYGIPTIFKQLIAIPGPCYDKGLMGIITLPFRVERRLDEWNSHLPPVRANYKDYIDYEKAVETWRGKGCAEIKMPDFVPVIGGKGIILCLDDLGNPNYYAALYPNIPLSSTEDLKGTMSIDQVSSATSPATEGVIVNGVSFTGQTPSTMFFPHIQEASELATSLQNTFVSKDETKDETASPTNVDTTSCTTVDVRSNTGDKLFATQLSGTLGYTASFSCDYNLPPNPACLDQVCDSDPGVCCSGTFCSHEGQHSYCRASTGGTQTCSKDIQISLSTTGVIPKIDDVWSQLVAGPESIFKMIFPKTNTTGSVGKIIDMPASTNITYQIEKPGSSISNADLKFPHVGGISEYFLKGIQTALRPKGYGDPITFDPNSADVKMADVCSASCNPDPTNVDMTGVKDRFISLANRWYGAGVTTKPRIDMYDTVVNDAVAAGVDPIFALENWLNESSASDYVAICSKLGGGDPTSQYCQQVLDFGILDQNIITTFNPDGTVIADHLVDQLKEFVNLPGFYISYCGHVNKCDLETWGAMFASGQCAATTEGNGHMASAMEIYALIAPPGQKFPCYPAKVP